MKAVSMKFESSLTGLKEVNSSFDTGVLRIAYHGRNHNKTSISKEVFERCIKTIYNCPVVCRYDRETDSFGGHDMDVVRDHDGNLAIRNLTTPVGCIPESASYWWDTVTEADGTQKEYLHVDVLLWKRQEAYEKIKRDGIVAHSMEINIKSGKTVDGYFEIDDFEFTAFALIGVAPCFESAAIELYTLKPYKDRLEDMMRELKEYYTKQTQRGDEIVTEEKNVQKEPCVETPVEQEDASSAEYALTANVQYELRMAFENGECVRREFGEFPRYEFADFDPEKTEVYAWDRTDWTLWGFKYAVNGDAVSVDFESKTRKKYVIVDFDGGEQADPFTGVFEMATGYAEKKSAAADEKQKELDGVYAELGELRAYKERVEREKREAAALSVFERFSCLAGVEAYEKLAASVKDGSCEMGADELTEKCYALLGRYAAVEPAKQKAPKISVDRKDRKYRDDAPYGGIVEKYSK